MTGFDLDRRIVHATTAAELRAIEIPYDSLIVAAGVTQSYFGHDELARYAPGMKTIDDALELRRRIFGAFEMAEVATDPAEREQWLTVVIVGAGPTGVELAGQVRELAVRCLKGEFRTFDPASVRVLLLDGGKEPLATFGDRLSGKATKELERLGVELRMGARVVGVDAFGVDVQAPTAASHGSRPTRRSGRPECRRRRWPPSWPKPAGPSSIAPAASWCCPISRCPGIPRSSPSVTWPPWTSCRAWPRSPCRAGSTRRTRSRGGSKARTPVPFKYRDLGSVATIGRFRAIASVRKVRLSGFPGWVVWFFVHLAFLTGFGDRFSTMLRWLRSMIGRGRAEREFSTAHTGGDLSLPESVRAVVQPTPFPSAPTTGETAGA